MRWGTGSDRQQTLLSPGPRTYPRGHTAAVYQEKRYWQSAVSWLNSGIPSFIKGSQWKKMVEETVFDLSFPHLEDEVNTTSRSPSVTEEGTTTTKLPSLSQQWPSWSSQSSYDVCRDLNSNVRPLHRWPRALPHRLTHITEPLP